MKKDGLFKTFLILFSGLLFIELVFAFLEFNSIFNFSFVRIIIFTLSITLLISFLLSFLNSKVIKIVIGILLFLFALYPYLQIGFYSLMGNYMSFNAASDGAVRVSEYVLIFIKNVELYAYILFLPLILYIVFYKKIMIERIKRPFYINMLIIAVILIIHSLSLLSLNVTPKGQIINNKKLYQEPSLLAISLNQFGSNRFMIRDFINIFLDYDDFEVIIEKPEEEVVTDYTRVIDDFEWEKMIEEESNSKIKMLHQFYINQSITPKNEYTGLFKDKNLILIMVEAFDYLAINENVTPTLYKLKEQGMFFDNYYAPKYSCTTGESEYIGLTSIVPSSTVCTPNSYTNNNYETSIFNIFNKSGYYSSSYHNWTDQFYNRTLLHSNMGSDKFYSYDDLKIKPIIGWPSDEDLMQKALPYFVQEDKFFSFIISSSMHFPYDHFTGIVKNNWDLVKDLDYPNQVKYYLAKSIEFDRGIKYLLDSLEESGKLDDTVIVLFGDHHPFNMNLSYIKDYSGIDRTENMNIDKSPFIIYNSKTEPQIISKTASTFDIVPTLANLFDLDYDPRYYVGKDIFSAEETTVIFTNGSWITDKAIYSASKGKHTKLEEVSDEYLLEVNKRVSDYMSVSSNTLIYDYFKYRFKK
jgi:lipoteichoic acid synthase